MYDLGAAKLHAQLTIFQTCAANSKDADPILASYEGIYTVLRCHSKSDWNLPFQSVRVRMLYKYWTLLCVTIELQSRWKTKFIKGQR